MKYNRIGLYFGSFNPLHAGHLFVIEQALKTAIDVLFVVVSPQSPFKTKEELASFNDRVAMADLAIRDSGLKDRVRVVRWEMYRYPSYTIDTLELAKKLLGKDINITIFMGLDNFKSIDTWKCANEIVGEYGIYVIPRNSPDFVEVINEKIKQLKEFYGKVKSISYSSPLDSIDISATQIRKMISDEEKIPEGWLTPSELEYIKKKDLYSIPMVPIGVANIS